MTINEINNIVIDIVISKSCLKKKSCRSKWKKSTVTILNLNVFQIYFKIDSAKKV